MWTIRRSRRARASVAAVLFAVALGACASTSPALAADLAVDSTIDAVDANPRNGVCATAAGRCSLRAAIE